MTTDERIKTIRDALLPLDDAWDALNSLLAELDAARAQEAKLREALTKAAPYSCAECGDHVKVDEDGCCAMCGGDAALAEGEDTK